VTDLEARVVAVCRDDEHRFSKVLVDEIVLSDGVVHRRWDGDEVVLRALREGQAAPADRGGEDERETGDTETRPRAAHAGHPAHKRAGGWFTAGQRHVPGGVHPAAHTGVGLQLDQRVRQ